MKPALLARVILILSALGSFEVFANERVLILGYQNELADNKVWQDNQVGFGVKNQLRQLLFDQKSLDILDEKTMVLQQNASATETVTLHNDQTPSWMLLAADVSVPHLSSIASKYHLDSIYWVKIVRFSKPKSELTIALWSSKKISKELTLQVCRFIAAQNSITCQEGLGRSTKRSRAFFYKPIKERHKRQQHFNDSAVGKISYQALSNALGNH